VSPGHSLLPRAIPHALTVHKRLSDSRDYTVTHRLVFLDTLFIALLLGNVFQQWTFFCSWAHVLAVWRLISTRHSYATACSNGGFSARGDCLSLGLSSSELKLYSTKSAVSRLSRPVGPRHIASGRSIRKYIFLMLLLQYDVALRRTHRKHRFPELLHCCVMSLLSRRRAYYATAYQRASAFSKYVTICILSRNGMLKCGIRIGKVPM
jgi:hypothetical protein